MFLAGTADVTSDSKGYLGNVLKNLLVQLQLTWL
jgi:hypothetical protein